MPIYEYRCTKCGYVFEEIASFSPNGNGKHKCGRCGAVAKRLISAPQVVFHGGGFYVTDNRSSNPACDPAKPAPTNSLPETPTVPAPAAKKDKGKSKE